MAKPAYGATLNTGNALGALVAHAWILNEGSGTAIHDLATTGGIAGTLTGSGDTWATGTDGPLIAGTATAGQIALSPGLTFSNNAPISFAFGAKVTTPLSSNTLGMVCGDSSTPSNFIWLGSATSNIQVRFNLSGGPNFVFNLTSPDFGNYHDYVITSDGAGHWNLYIDGALGAPQQSAIATTGTGTINTLANGYNSNAYKLAGNLNYLYVFNAALTSGQAATLASAPYQIASAAGLAAGTLSSGTPTLSSVPLSLTSASNGTSPYAYTLKRGTDGTTFSNLITHTGQTGSDAFTDTTVTPGATYYYEVVVTDAASATATSNVVGPVAIPTVSLPSAPTISIATSGGTDTISYTASTAGSNPIAGYSLYLGTSAGGESGAAASTNSGSGSGTFTHATPTTGSYYYRVKAFDNAGTPNYSAASNEVSSTAPVSPTITLTTPSNYQIFQRGATNKANIPISGTYTGSPTAIEASWNGGAFQTIVSSPSGGTFSGKLPLQSIGQGPLVVRFVNSTSVSATATPVSIGDIYVGIGQSNMSGRLSNNQAFVPQNGIAGSTWNGSWMAAADPTGYGNTGAGRGSAFLLMLNLAAAANPTIPVGGINVAIGGTSMPVWSQSGGLWATQALPHLQAAGVNGVRAFLWHQGETDAGTGMSTATYQAAMATMGTLLRASFPEAPFIVCKLQNVVGDTTDGGAGGTTLSELQAIQAAQANEWAVDPNVIAGPDLSDLVPSGNPHFLSNTEGSTVAARYWSAVAPFVPPATTGGGAGGVPRIGKALIS